MSFGSSMQEGRKGQGVHQTVQTAWSCLGWAVERHCRNELKTAF